MNEKEDVITLTPKQLLKHKGVSGFLKGKKYIGKPPTVEVYQEFQRGLVSNNKTVSELYKERFNENWKWGSEGYKTEEEQKTQEDNADLLIKKLLDVDDKALTKFKQGYRQDVGSVAIIPFTLMGAETLTKNTHLDNLYKTSQGNIGVRTELNIHSIQDLNNSDIYNIQCKIEANWEPNAKGHYELKSMKISGRDKELVAQLFLNYHQNSIPDFFPKKFVERICQEENAKENLFIAASINSAIYKEIVEPRDTRSRIRKLGEFIGFIGPASPPKRPEFTKEEHLRLIAAHPHLLNEDRKNNPYQAILNSATLEEKLSFSPNLLTPQEKLSILTDYATNSPERLSSLNKAFFNELDQDLSSIITDRRDNLIYQNLETLLTTADLSVLKEIKSQLPEVFSQYTNNWSDSIISINHRLQMVAKCNKSEENLARFGKEFLLQLNNDLLVLAQKGFNNPTMNKVKNAAIQSILNILSTHEDLYNVYSRKPEFQAVLTPPVNSKADQYAKEAKNHIEHASEQTKQDIDKGNKLITSIETKVIAGQQAETPEITPSESPTAHQLKN